MAAAVSWAAGGFRGGSGTSHEQVGRSFDIGPATIIVRSATVFGCRTEDVFTPDPWSPQAD